MQIRNRVFSSALGLGLIAVFTGLWPAVASDVSFNQDIRPILSNNCFQCHGPDEADRQAGLRLDMPGEVDLQELLARVTASDPDLMMPPPDSNKELTQSQIDKLAAWVTAGGEYEQHWAFIPPASVQIPPATGEWGQLPIDAFVVQRLRQLDLQPNQPVDRRTLIRRVTLDLTGLPPTLEEIQQFLNDASPNAYEKLVNRLLDSPHYGEHMARYWLDLVRFADTNGLHHDHYREMTPYRDWVIRSFNENLGYDQFTTYQLAGDLLSEPTTDQLIASGFNRLHLIIDRGTALPEESFMRNVVDRVSAVGTAFMGLTLECAVCHDHKYDPITQRDFYQLYAFFNNFDGNPETGGRSGLDFKRGLQPPYLELPTADQTQRRDALQSEIAKLQTELESVEAVASAESAAADLKQQQESLKAELTQRRQELNSLIESIPATLVMKEREEVRPAHIMIRGNYDQPGEQVRRDTPGFLPELASTDVPDRLDLARWLVQPEHPLTARVAVNRFWQQLFGVGLVKTSEDFGAQGEPPSHPALLDYLAHRFVDSGWDVKALMRNIVMSQTYRQSSRASESSFISDPGNRLLARGSRYRYDAEVIRDQVLAVSGLLDRTLYGKSVKPPQPAGLWTTVAMPNSYPRVYQADHGNRIYRRSVYSFWKRALPPPQMTIFDAPFRESCTARRERTNTPLQALVLMNEQQYFLAAMNLAQRVRASKVEEDAAAIQRAYEIVTAKRPDVETQSVLQEALGTFRRIYREDPDALSQMLATARESEEPVSVPSRRDDQVELAAWTMLAHSLLNLDVTKTRE